MAKIEPVLKIWYDALNENKILGLKCNRCGSVEFPPVPICNDCSCTDMEWVEMSGEGELDTFCFSPMGIPPYHEEPTMCGFGRLKEGMLFNSAIVNATGKDQNALSERLSKTGPIPFAMVVTKLDENISFPQFVIKD